MSKILIYHNPRWGKSRESVKILENSDYEYETIDYINSPPSQSELQTLADKMGIRAKDFIRSRESEFKELNLKAYLDDDARSFIKNIETKLGVTVTLIGTGPHVDDVIDLRT